MYNRLKRFTKTFKLKTLEIIMVPKITIRDVSEKAQVSTTTVSFVLNNTGKVSAATRRKVLEAVDELGYVPDVRARSLKNSRIQSISLMFTFSEEMITASRYFRDVVSSITATATEKDYKVIINLLQRHNSLEQQIREAQFGGYVGGIILIGANSSEVELVSDIIDDFPAILLCSRSDDPTISYIDADNFDAMRQAINHLVGLAHENIAYLTAPESDSHSKQRLNAYYELMEEFGLGQYINVYSLPEQQETETIMPLLGNLPSAIIAFDDYRALQLISNLTHNGLSVPDDISIVSFDNENFGLHVSPQLTTFPVPFWDMGKAAADELIKKMNGESKKPVTRIFPMDMIIRETSGPHNPYTKISSKDK
jgi:DNA-binding LacI/PurR family transcriptional regulator